MKDIALHRLRYMAVRSGWFFLTLLLFYLVPSFWGPRINFVGYTIINPFYEWVRLLDWWLYLLVYFVAVSLINAVVFLFLSLYFSLQKDRVQRIKGRYEVIFTQKVIHFIYSDRLTEGDDLLISLDYLRKRARGKLLHEVLFTVITRIQESVTENFSVKFTSLIEELGLDGRIHYFLYSRNLSERIIALKMISYLRMNGYEKVITRYSRSKNYVLRTEAMAALIRLTKSDHLNFLLSYSYPISQMDFNVIVNAVEKNWKTDIDYSSLLKCSNERVAAIGLMLVKDRGLTEYKREVEALLHTAHEWTREIAWEVFSSLANSAQDLQIMIDGFAGENYQNKMFIIRGVNNFELNDSVMGFLDNVIYTQEATLKIEALKILFEKDVERLVDFKRCEDDIVIKAYEEVVDMNINR